MQKVTYTNSRGESLSFAYDPPFLLSGIEGLGDLTADTQMQKSPYQDGSTHVDTVLEPRYIPITFTLRGNNYAEIADLRRLISKVFNPKLGLGKLEYETNNVVREIYAICDGSPFFPSGDSRGITHQVGTIDLLAPNPYWRSPEQTTEPLAAFMPKFTFPFKFPVQFGERGSEAMLYNDGDVPAPVLIEFNGPSQLPVITNRTTGEFIRIKKEIKAGEKLIINTAHGQDSMVAIDRGNGIIENAWHYIDIWESTLFNLEVGENIIEYDAVASGGQAVVNITYQKLYVGV